MRQGANPHIGGSVQPLPKGLEKYAFICLTIMERFHFPSELEAASFGKPEPDHPTIEGTPYDEAIGMPYSRPLKSSEFAETHPVPPSARHELPSTQPKAGAELSSSERLGEFADYNDATEHGDEAIPPSNGLPSNLADRANQEKLTADDLAVNQTNGKAPSDADSASDQATGESQDTGFWPVLNNRNFLVLWSGQVFSQLADKVYLVLMIMLIASHFQAPGQSISGWVSSIMVAFTIPAVLFGSVAGVFVDHWPKKTTLVSTNLLRGVLVLAIPFLLWMAAEWAPMGDSSVGFLILLTITFLVSTLTQFFAPAEQSAIPLLVERRHLLSANSLYTTTMMASVIVGFAVGEPLLALSDTLLSGLGVTQPDLGKELLVGGSYAIAGLLLLSLRTCEKDVDADQPPPKVWENIRDGLRYLNEKAHVRAAIIQLVILFSIFAALAVLAVRLAEVMPTIKASQFGFLLAAGGVGMAAGAFWVGHGGQRFSRMHLSLYGSMGVGLSLVALSFVTAQFVPALLVLACVGAFAALVGIPMQTVIQEQTPEDMRGKVFGLQNNAINIALSLPLALAGMAESYFGLRVVFLALAAAAIASGILTWVISRPTTSKTAT
jgi:MFS family permease